MVLELVFKGNTASNPAHFVRLYYKTTMTFRVLHHNNCFDGACSAALFTKFHRERIGGADAYEYCGLQHQPGGAMSQDIFGAGENAIVDFKYSASPRLTWWFDHHESAFLTPELREQFEEGQRGDRANRQFFDPAYISCTGFIAHIGRTKFGFDTTGLDDLLKWADIIDGARFSSPEAAVEMREPAMKLALVVENTTDPHFIPRVIPMLTVMSFEEIIAQPFVQELIQPLWDKHTATKKLVRERAELKDGVVKLDILDQETEALNKFIPYYFFPEATYTIAATRSKFRTKISVGTNPWTTRTAAELENLSEVCERYGGGGHARVGAISYGPEEAVKGSLVTSEIVENLRAIERLR